MRFNARGLFVALGILAGACATRSVMVRGQFQATGVTPPPGSTFAVYTSTSPATVENKERILQLAGHLLRERGYEIRSDNAAFGLSIDYVLETIRTPQRMELPSSQGRASVVTIDQITTQSALTATVFSELSPQGSAHVQGADLDYLMIAAFRHVFDERSSEFSEIVSQNDVSLQNLQQTAKKEATQESGFSKGLFEEPEPKIESEEGAIEVPLTLRLNLRVSDPNDLITKGAKSSFGRAFKNFSLNSAQKDPEAALLGLLISSIERDSANENRLTLKYAWNIARGKDLFELHSDQKVVADKNADPAAEERQVVERLYETLLQQVSEKLKN